MSFYGFLKKLVLFVLIVAIAVPLRYGSTNHQYVLMRLLHSTLSLKHCLLSDQARPTLSADYRAFEEILRMHLIPEIDPLRDPLSIVKEIRSSVSLAAAIPKPTHCQVTRQVFEHDTHTVDAFWVNHHQKKLQKESNKIVLYFHGGGYISGDIHSYSGFECHLSQLFNVTILHVEYRLIPEHPFPAALDDATAIYRALLLHNISPSQMVIMGDSAGGGLALLTVQAIIARQLSVPRGVIVLSPQTDLSLSGESYTRNRLTDVMLSTNTTKWMVKILMGTNHPELSPDSSFFSPLFGTFEGFPPMYINVGTADIIEDDSRRLVKKAQDAGVDVTFEEGLHLMHIYPIFFLYYPEARNTLNNINKWIQKI
ncbi:unnamed protein product [Rotaria sp. Silwood2]|nr:unnamed protein product [Rotaria sp. Silwood2]CAF2909283.1 unnamed protein product [Rotaria sp. Silwood2]CAF3301902.1 unnamed protein product [Rotaria sp. Silwood2]CAF4413243.1 unnamed protein product [Rotaria sp. Silwood2]CAF4489267.1 unnamed protein product [Rotaria sp. Silwood2]